MDIKCKSKYSEGSVHLLLFALVKQFTLRTTAHKTYLLAPAEESLYGQWGLKCAFWRLTDLSVFFEKTK